MDLSYDDRLLFTAAFDLRISAAITNDGILGGFVHYIVSYFSPDETQIVHQIIDCTQTESSL
jgi:hypothetical protein